MKHSPCSSVPLLGVITMCMVMSGIIGSDTTQYVTTQINCRFKLFFKLNIITCPAQHIWHGIIHSYSWQNLFFFLFFFLPIASLLFFPCVSVEIIASGINKTFNGSFFLLLLHQLHLCSTGFLGLIKQTRHPYYL